MSTLKIVVGVPHMGSWEADFGACMLQMQGHFTAPGNKKLPPGAQLMTSLWQGSILSNAREFIVDDAIKAEATHLLFIDTDMTFPKDTIERLVARQKPVIGANCATKTMPPGPTARSKTDKPGGEPVFTKEDSPPVERVWRLGTGLMLLDMKYIRGLERPLFPVVWQPEVHQYQGEDWSFCRKLEEANIPIFVDHELSRQIGHIGRIAYHHRMIGKIEATRLDEGDVVPEEQVEFKDAS